MKVGHVLGTLLLTSFAIISCNPTDEPVGGQFDREKMLDNFAQNLIVPGFADATVKSADLVEKVKSLQTSPNAEKLALAQSSWQSAYKSYLNVSMYNFGPAGEESIKKSLAEEVSTFPTNEGKIAVKTATATPSFSDFERDSRGFLALDYLLFKNGALNDLSVNANYRNYTLKVAEDINKRISDVHSAWAVYQTEFINNNGTDAGSSTSAVYNEFVKSYEGLKNFKVGLPLGLRPGQTKAEPNRVEALYSGLSLDFIKTQFNALTNLWKGGNGIGFDDYLEKVEGGPTLAVSTKEQVKIIDSQLNAFSTTDKLSQLITTNETAIKNLHTELQKNTRFFKSELSSLLGIAITFTSGDGD